MITVHQHHRHTNGRTTYHSITSLRRASRGKTDKQSVRSEY